jgi:hypothetical protein
MSTWDKLNKDQRTQAEDSFVALSTLDDLLTYLVPAEEQSRKLGFDDLYQYVVGTRELDQMALYQALKQNRTLAESFDLLLRNEASYYMPQAAAASSGDIDEREGEGFKIRLKLSRATPDQIYVMIEFEDLGAEFPSNLFLMPVSGECTRLDLPKGSDGTVQLIAEAGSDLIRNLRDPKTEVFLR